MSVIDPSITEHLGVPPGWHLVSLLLASGERIIVGESRLTLAGHQGLMPADVGRFARLVVLTPEPAGAKPRTMEIIPLCQVAKYIYAAGDLSQ